jgi:hypothetical protein
MIVLDKIPKANGTVANVTVFPDASIKLFLMNPKTHSNPQIDKVLVR